MPLERPPPRPIEAPSSGYESTSRLKAPEPRRASATWIARSTMEELPSFADDEESTDTKLGLGASGSRTVPLPRSLEAAAPIEVPPPSRVPTIVPRGLTFAEVLEAAMAL